MVTTALDSLGGPEGVTAVVAVFYRRMLGDPRLAPYFDGVDLARLRAHQRALLLAALDGRDLVLAHQLGAAHRGLAIGHTEFDLVLEHLTGALADLGASVSVIADVTERLERFRVAIVAPARVE